jgi:hypothetical protein
VAELDGPGDVGWDGFKPGADAECVSETGAATAAADGVYGLDVMPRRPIGGDRKSELLIIDTEAERVHY